MRTLSLLLLTSCAGPLPADEYCERTSGMFCEYYLRCGRMAEQSQAECEATFLQTCNAVYEPHYAALAGEGRLQLSRPGLRACRDHLATVACDEQLQDLQGPCGAMWEGLEGPGEACGLGIESFVCDADSTCVIGLDLCGTCVAAAPTGGACDTDVRCHDEDECVDGTCVARGVPGASCDDAHPCLLGATCDAGTCAGWQVVAVGDACDADHRCPYRAACIGGECVQSALLGEACGADRACASGVCTDGVCTALGAGGDACGAGYECLSGACDGDVCADLPGACFSE